MSATQEAIPKPKKRTARLLPEDNSFYVGRDTDGSLYQYESQPKWTGFDFVPQRDGEDTQRMPEDWFASLEPGCCVKVGPYGSTIDMKGNL